MLKSNNFSNFYRNFWFDVIVKADECIYSWKKIYSAHLNATSHAILSSVVQILMYRIPLWDMLKSISGLKGNQRWKHLQKNYIQASYIKRKLRWESRTAAHAASRRKYSYLSKHSWKPAQYTLYSIFTEGCKTIPASFREVAGGRLDLCKWGKPSHWCFEAI